MLELVILGTLTWFWGPIGFITGLLIWAIIYILSVMAGYAEAKEFLRKEEE